VGAGRGLEMVVGRGVLNVGVLRTRMRDPIGVRGQSGDYDVGARF
jgi:hypothetical protein